MPEECEGDVAGANFWCADLSGARRSRRQPPDAQGSHACLVNVDIDALVDTVVIDGVDVTTYVNDRDRWYLLGAILGPPNPGVTSAHALSEDTLRELANDEWTFEEELWHSRHAQRDLAQLQAPT